MSAGVELAKGGERGRPNLVYPRGGTTVTSHFKFTIRGNVRAGPLKRLCTEASGGCTHVLECDEIDWSRYAEEEVIPGLRLTLGILTPSEEEALLLADRIGGELCMDEYLLEVLHG
jgi:hypothetical protein